MGNFSVSIANESGEPLGGIPTVRDQTGVFHFLIPSDEADSELTIVVEGLTPSFPSIPFKLPAD